MTLADVANDAGVAINTVRKALNDDPTVRPYLRERVLQSVGRLNYRPNVLARGLAKQQLDIVPISIGRLQELFFAQLADHLSDELVAIDLEPALCTTADRLIHLNDTLCTCGSILAYTDYHHLTRPLAERQPVVTINGPYYRQANLGCVMSDFGPPFRHAAEAALRDGRSRMAVVSRVYDHTSKKQNWPFAKFNHVEDVLREAGSALVHPPDAACFADAGALLGCLHTDRQAIDTVFCENDVVAAQVVAALTADGFRLPDDILVIGCDANIPMTGCWSIRIDTAELAALAVTVLSDLLAGNENVEPGTSTPILVDDTGQPI